MNESMQGWAHSRHRAGERTRAGRPPLLKVTRALIGASISQGDPRTALRLLGNALRTASSLPVADQLELVHGVLEELRDEITHLFVAAIPTTGARG